MAVGFHQHQRDACQRRGLRKPRPRAPGVLAAYVQQARETPNSFANVSRLRLLLAEVRSVRFPYF
jgi:hypothetical protein